MISEDLKYAQVIVCFMVFLSFLELGKCSMNILHNKVIFFNKSQFVVWKKQDIKDPICYISFLWEWMKRLLFIF